jgi:outer membrane protein assembly factor BamE
MRLRRLLLAVVLALSACSYIPHVGVYKLEVNQGNYVTQDMVEKLRPGMTKSQVRLVLGTPLVIDVFHADRWDYVYHHEVGGATNEQRRFSVLFQEDKLASWEGDKAPAVVTYKASTSGTAPTAPEEKGFFRNLLDKIGL